MPRISSTRTSRSPLVSQTPRTTTPFGDSVVRSGNETKACVFDGARAVAKEIGRPLIRRGAVEVVRVERDERAVDGVAGREHRRHRASRDLRAQLLVGEHHLETVPVTAGDRLDARRELVADHEHRPVEAGAARIDEQVINQRFIGRAYGLELFGTAKPRAHTRSHHDNRQCHSCQSDAGEPGERVQRLWKIMSHGAIAASRYKPVRAPSTP